MENNEEKRKRYSENWSIRSPIAWSWEIGIRIFLAIIYGVSAMAIKPFLRYVEGTKNPLVILNSFRKSREIKFYQVFQIFVFLSFSA